MKSEIKRTWAARAIAAAAGLASAGAGSALAQEGGAQAGGEQGTGEAAAANEVALSSGDAELTRVVEMLTGTFAGPAATKAEGDTKNPVIVLHAAPVRIFGMTDGLYFEVAREDSPQAPMRQGVFQVYKRRGELRLRVHDFVSVGTIGSAVAGMWAVPEVFPLITSSGLRPNMEYVLVKSGEGYEGKTAHPFASTFRGASEVEGEITISAGSVSIADRGYSAEGAMVWGVEAGTRSTLKRTEPRAVVTRGEEGLVWIDLIPGEEGAPSAEAGGQIVVHYAGHLLDGFMFDSSRLEGRSPFVVKLPAQIMEGWNRSLPGMKKGQWRRIVVPPALGYGERGAPRARIGPNETLVFDVECLHVDPPAPVPVPAASEAGGESDVGKPASEK